MAVIGGADGWLGTFRDDLIPQILDLVIAVWAKFAKPQRDEAEVPITRRLCVELEKEHILRMLPVRIDLETTVLDLETAQELGRIDLRFNASFRADTYFSMECKRVNVTEKGTIKPKTSLYVTEGMMRYITGKYASSLLKGGMIAYVMDGKVTDAMNSVNTSIKNKKTELKIKPPHGLSPSTLRPQCDKTRETTHDLVKGDFVIHHVFLPA